MVSQITVWSTLSLLLFCLEYVSGEPSKLPLKEAQATLRALLKRNGSRSAAKVLKNEVETKKTNWKMIGWGNVRYTNLDPTNHRLANLAIRMSVDPSKGISELPAHFPSVLRLDELVLKGEPDYVIFDKETVDIFPACCTHMMTEMADIAPATLNEFMAAIEAGYKGEQGMCPK